MKKRIGIGAILCALFVLGVTMFNGCGSDSGAFVLKSKYTN